MDSAVSQASNIDTALLEKFEQEIWSKIPHLRGDKIENATPLVDLTDDLKECSKSLYKFDLSNENLKVYGKFDADLVSGSIKVRPAVHIIHDAIKTGKLKSGQTIIEATSGNFGIALGQMSKLAPISVGVNSDPSPICCCKSTQFDPSYFCQTMLSYPSGLGIFNTTFDVPSSFTHLPY